MRITVAHVLRVLLDAMPPGALAGSQKDRDRLVELASDALRFLNSNPQGASRAPCVLLSLGPATVGSSALSCCLSILPVAFSL